MIKEFVAIIGVAITLGAGVGTAAAKAPNGKLKLSALSTKPELVTGGDVLIALDASGSNPLQARVRLNGVEVTSSFSPEPGRSNRLVGLVEGLRDGDNLITAYGPGVRRPARLSVFNSPITGPVFSGPHQAPFFCRTEDAGLGPAIDADCSAPSTVDHFYRATDNSFKALADPTGPLPPDGVQTTTRDGRTVDYVVRVESGVINRSIYRFAILAPGGEIGESWNRRLVFTFGGGCSAGYQQGNRSVQTALENAELSQGYAILTGSLNVFGVACNDVLSAESALMLKEHVIEELGERPAWTMGQGGSGGSVQQQMIAQNYPGILDGIMPGASFPDGSAPDYPDCRLLNTYFETSQGASLNDAQRMSITGLADPDGCLPLGVGADVVAADEGCDERQISPDLIFDPILNPDGVRCTVWDSMINVYGEDPATGYARRTLDNVGVQYGVEALNEGDLTVDEFLDLNEGIGGYDDNGELRRQRSVADDDALAIAYESGRINFGAGGYGGVPVLDIRRYQDAGINVHQSVNAYRMRARLQATNGNYDNHVMWRADNAPSVNAMNAAALETLAGWMDAIDADPTNATASQKVVTNKPADAVDACWINGERFDGPAMIGASNVCETTFPPQRLPVDRAGRPLDSVVLKCQLKPIDYGDYDPAFDSTQGSRLESVFPGGVCDWSLPGVEQGQLAGTWQEFGPERVIGKRSRKLGLRARATSGRARAVELTASLKPCPEASYQEVTFERKRKGTGTWRRFDSDIATGGKCRASARLKVKQRVRARARAEAIEGYAVARSKSKRL